MCVNRINLGKSDSSPEFSKRWLNRVIQLAPTLYALQKRIAYLREFVNYMECKARKQEFKPPRIDAPLLEKALDLVVHLVQQDVYGKVGSLLGEGTPDDFEKIIQRCGQGADQFQRPQLKELRSLKKYRPCLDDNGSLRIEGRLSKSSSIPWEAKHPYILPSKHPLTRLIVLSYHVKNAHSGVQHTLLSTRNRFWIANGNASVRRYLRECSRCAIEKAQPIRQLMSDLPPARTTAQEKPFSHCGMDYFGPIIFVEGRCQRKAWGLLFTCMSSRAIHVELVTSLSLSDFVLAFTRFSDLRGPIKTAYSDNGSTFQAASKALPKLLNTPGFQNFLREKDVSWNFSPPYAPAQGGGAWESLVKQVKLVISRILDETLRKPSFIELLTYVGSAVRIVNERPLIPLSDDPKDFTAITPASLLTPYSCPLSVVGEPEEKDRLRKDYRYNVSLCQQFWNKWIKFYLPWLQGRKKWLKLRENLKPDQLVVLGSLEDITTRGKYQLGRVHEVIPQVRKGKQIVRRAKVATTKRDENTGKVKIDYVLRDISCIAPVENTSSGT